MGRQGAQGSLSYGLRLDDHVPGDDHLPRRLDGLLGFRFMREALACSYSTVGLPSISPELMLWMVLVGYLFGIRSERRLCQEVYLNFADRWFCVLTLVSTTAFLATNGPVREVDDDRKKAVVLLVAERS